MGLLVDMADGDEEQREQQQCHIMSRLLALSTQSTYGAAVAMITFFRANTSIEAVA